MCSILPSRHCGFAASALCVLLLLTSPLLADSLRVPQDHATIQAAIDAAAAGDTIVVSAGTYRERLRLKAGVTVRSFGDNARGKLGLKRAEATILDGRFRDADGPGVAMAEGSTLDGFTVTGVGKYDDALWKKHHATKGAEQSHDHIGVPGTAGIAVIGVTHCTVTNNIVYHIGYTGIVIVGAPGKRVSPRIAGNTAYRNMGGGIGSMKGSTAVIDDNLCFENFYAGIGHNNASPVVTNNVCRGNIRAGIGISEHSRPIVRGNRCYGNRRAGIGIRTGVETAPIVEDNDCYENGMAGIGVSEKAAPIIRNNRCHRNASVGIGCSGGARPLIVGNECIENRRVAIGVTGGSTAHIVGNLLVRTGGMPPLIQIRGGSSAVLADNTLKGGGIAGIVVDGTAAISGNRFVGNGPRAGPGPPNFAVWGLGGSTVSFSDNHIEGWRHAFHASGAKRVSVTGNRVSRFLGTAIVVDKSQTPAHVFGNVAISDNAADQVASVEGSRGVVADNVRKAP